MPTSEEQSRRLEARLVALEKKMAEVDRRAPKATGFYEFAFFIALVAYGLIVFNVPGLGDGSERVIPALLALVAGFVVFGVALGVVSSSLKVLIEAATAFLVLINVLVAFFAWQSSSELARFALESGVAAEDALFVGLVGAAVVLFLLDVFVLLTLYPLAQAAGTKLD